MLLICICICLFYKKIVRWKCFYISEICAKSYIENVVKNGQHIKTILQK